MERTFIRVGNALLDPRRVVAAQQGDNGITVDVGTRHILPIIGVDLDQLLAALVAAGEPEPSAGGTEW